ncbi:hypothetical protein V5J73_05425 [Flavobacterium sp. KS-LB2]|uniref:hypothetical protein n=1 Tax=Flavobacterium sp. KS-LB2 TaxID=3120525 RepID=UPI0030D3E516
MKKYLIILSTILMSFTVINDAPIDRIGVPGPLIFNSKDFNFSWSDKPNETYYIQEYFPKKQSAENYKEMLTIHLFVTDLTLNDAVDQKIEELNIRKQTDITCNYKANYSPDKKEIIVDFVLSDMKNNIINTAEFNIYRYKQIDLDNNKKGILIFAYTKRNDKNSVDYFFNNLGDIRKKSLKTMISIEMPKVKILEN